MNAVLLLFREDGKLRARRVEFTLKFRDEGLLFGELGLLIRGGFRSRRRTGGAFLLQFLSFRLEVSCVTCASSEVFSVPSVVTCPFVFSSSLTVPESFDAT